jgi:hypothetical protein
MYWTDVRFCTGFLMEEAPLRLGPSVFLGAVARITEAKRRALRAIVAIWTPEKTLMQISWTFSCSTLYNVSILNSYPLFSSLHVFIYIYVQ